MASKFPHLEDNCKKAVEHFKTDVSKLRSGRASASMIETVSVDYYGSLVPMIQMGLINTPEPRLITIQVYDGGAVEAVEKAIMKADLGLSPSRDGNLVRLLIPALTEERRKEVIKKLHKMAEESKIVLRNYRREQIDELKEQEKKKLVSADELKRGQDEIQKILDSYIANIESIVAAKEKDMMEV